MERSHPTGPGNFRTTYSHATARALRGSPGSTRRRAADWSTPATSGTAAASRRRVPRARRPRHEGVGVRGEGEPSTLCRLPARGSARSPIIAQKYLAACNHRRAPSWRGALQEGSEELGLVWVLHAYGNGEVEAVQLLSAKNHAGSSQITLWHILEHRGYQGHSFGLRYNPHRGVMNLAAMLGRASEPIRRKHSRVGNPSYKQVTIRWGLQAASA